MLVTLVILRWQLSRKVLAAAVRGAGSTIDRALAGIRPLLTACGFAVPDRPGIGLRTLADVFAYAEAGGITLRIDGTQVQVRRPKAHLYANTRRQSRRRIMVEHAIAEPKQRRSMQRRIGDRDDLPEVIAAIGALVSDRAAAGLPSARRAPNTS